MSCKLTQLFLYLLCWWSQLYQYQDTSKKIKLFIVELEKKRNYTNARQPL